MASPLTVPNHLLAEILFRLTAPADLARASAACVAFRRLITDVSFLRRFRRLHAPPLLGFLDPGGLHLHLALPPHPSAPAAGALALASDFSFSFLPSHCRWAVQDIRDGRILLHRQHEQGEQPQLFRELAVCDPLHRRYVLLPQLPDDLAAPVEHTAVPMDRRSQSKPFLVPLGKEETAAGETAFRVIYMVHSEANLSAYIFSSSTGQWRAAASKAWSDLVHDRRDSDIMSQVHPFFLMRHYAYGCFYWDWLPIKRKKLLVLDTRRMEFSMADLPPGEWSTRGLAIVEAGDGRPGMFGFHDKTRSDIRYTVAQNKGESPSRWQMEKTISLDAGYIYCIRDATEGYLLLTRAKASSIENPLVEYFSMDVKTMQLQRICAKLCVLTYGTRIYANFPPSLLSSPTI